MSGSGVPWFFFFLIFFGVEPPSMNSLLLAWPLWARFGAATTFPVQFLFIFLKVEAGKGPGREGRTAPHGTRRSRNTPSTLFETIHLKISPIQAAGEAEKPPGAIPKPPELRKLLDTHPPASGTGTSSPTSPPQEPIPVPWSPKKPLGEVFGSLLGRPGPRRGGEGSKLCRRAWQTLPSSPERGWQVPCFRGNQHFRARCRTHAARFATQGCSSP